MNLGLNKKTVNLYFSYIVLIAIFLIVGFMFKDFALLFLNALVFSIILKPIYDFFMLKFNRKYVSATLSVAIFLVIFLVPLTLIGFSMVGEVSSIVDEGTFNFNLNISQAFEGINFDIGKVVGDNVEKGINKVTDFVISLPNLVLDFAIITLMLFFLLVNLDKLENAVKNLNVFTVKIRRKVWNTFYNSINMIFYGHILTSLVQAFVAYIGYAILGVRSPLLYAVITFMTSLVPVFGAFATWFTIAIFLLFTDPIKGIILMIYGSAVISTIDNFLRPFILKENLKLPFIVVLLSILGGLQFFGVMGVFLGPAIFLVFMEISKEIFLEKLDDSRKKDDIGNKKRKFLTVISGDDNGYDE